MLGCVFIAAIYAATLPQAGPVVFAGAAQIDQPRIHLGDIANLSSLPPRLRDRAGSLTIANLPNGRDRMALSRKWTVERARALMPALAPWLTDDTDSAITVRLTKSAQSDADAHIPPSCLEAKRFIPAGSVATVDGFKPTTCDGAHLSRAFGFSASTRSVRTVRDLQSGERVASVPLSELAAVLPGERLYVTTRVGAVRIEREVKTIQPAATGQSLFVRADDGSVFSVPGPRSAP